MSYHITTPLYNNIFPTFFSSVIPLDRAALTLSLLFPGRLLEDDEKGDGQPRA